MESRSLSSAAAELATGILVLRIDTLQFVLEFREGGFATTVTLSDALCEAPRIGGSLEPGAARADCGATEDEESVSPPEKPETASSLLLDPTLVLRFDDGRALDLKSGELSGPMAPPSEAAAMLPLQRLPCPMQHPQPLERHHGDEREDVDEVSPPRFVCDAFELGVDEFMQTVGRLYFLCKSLYPVSLFDFDQVRFPVGSWERMLCRARDGVGRRDCVITAADIAQFRQRAISWRHWCYCRNSLAMARTTAAAAVLEIAPPVPPTEGLWMPSLPPPAPPGGQSTRQRRSLLSLEELHQLWVFCATPKVKDPKLPLCVDKCPVARAAIKALAVGTFAVQELLDALRQERSISAGGTEEGLLPLRVIALTGNTWRLREAIAEYLAVAKMSSRTAPYGFQWLMLQLEAAVGSVDAYQRAREVLRLLDFELGKVGGGDGNTLLEIARCIAESSLIATLLRRELCLHDACLTLDHSADVLAAHVKKGTAAGSAALPEPELLRRYLRKVQLLRVIVGHRIGHGTQQLQDIIKDIFSTFSVDAETWQREENVFSGLPSPTSSLQLVDSLLRAQYKTPIHYYYAVVMLLVEKKEYSRHLLLVATRLSPPSLADAAALRPLLLHMAAASDGASGTAPAFAPLGHMDESFLLFRGRAHWATVFARLRMLADFRKERPLGFAIERLQDHIGLLEELPVMLPGSIDAAPALYLNAVGSLISMVGEGFSCKALKSEKEAGMELWESVRPHLHRATELCDTLSCASSCSRNEEENAPYFPERTLAVAQSAKLLHLACTVFRKEVEQGKVGGPLLTALRALDPDFRDPRRATVAPAEAMLVRLQLLRELCGNSFEHHEQLLEGFEGSVANTVSVGRVSMFTGTTSGAHAKKTPLLLRCLAGFVAFGDANQPTGFCSALDVFLSVAHVGSPHLLGPWHVTYTERCNCGFVVWHRFSNISTVLQRAPSAGDAVALLRIAAEHLLGALSALHSCGLAHQNVCCDTVVMCRGAPPNGSTFCFQLLVTGDEVRRGALMPVRPPQERHLSPPAAHTETAQAKLRQQQANDYVSLGTLLREVLECVSGHFEASTADSTFTQGRRCVERCADACIACENAAQPIDVMALRASLLDD